MHHPLLSSIAVLALRPSLILCAALCCCMGFAARADFCKDLQSLAALKSGATISLPGMSGTAPCKTSLMLSGGTQAHCSWAFAYRAAVAQETFQQVLADVTACAGDHAEITADQDVNHPDFYDLQTFRVNDFEVGVSLKDKAALGETYVFLRVSPLN
ncbi:MAG: hypothetical protein AB8B58_08505 [Roseobacter sp.]